MNSQDIGELLDELQKRMDRCKVLFEQYFMGIQKQPPMQMQIELERRIRKLTQTHIVNTGLRFRFTTLSQRFGSYNTYWKRTMRQMENGTYHRDIARIGRKAARTGAEIPEEILAKMPKRMRDRIERDRAAILKQKERRAERAAGDKAAGKVLDNKPGNVHSFSESDMQDLDDLDMDALFGNITSTGDESSPGGVAAKADLESGNLADDIGDDFFSAFDDSPSPSNVSPAKPAPKPAPRPAPRPAAAKPAPARPSRPSAPPAPPRAAAPKRPSMPPPIPGGAPKKPAAPATKPPPGMSVAEGQALFKKYKKARELTGANTDNLSYDKLMRSLNKKAPKILKDHNAKGVSFGVVVKGDKVVLKAKPKK